MTPNPKSPFLNALDERSRGRLLDRGVPRSLRAGETLYLAGDRAPRVHLVMRGILKLSARDADGRETILALLVPGDISGDVAALDGLGQPFDAVAATTAEVVGIDAELFLEVMGDAGIAAMEIARALGSRLRWISGTALERTSSEVPARLAGRLLDLADLIGRIDGGRITLDLPLAQGDLGRLAGMCRESACKTLRRFKAEGLVDYQGRRLQILRPEVLEAVRCGEPVAGSCR